MIMGAHHPLMQDTTLFLVVATILQIKQHDNLKRHASSGLDASSRD